MSTQRASQRRFTVSHAHDPAETQAEKAAQVVARGGSVSGWSFGQVPVSASVHRDETGDKPPKKGSAGDVLEALSETPVGKQVIEKIKEREDVKAVLGALDTTGGKAAAGGVAVAGLAGFAAAKKELPAQIPAIPVGTIGGYDAKAALKIEGPVNSPTFVGVTLSFSGHSEGKKKQSSEDYRAETAKLRSQQEALLPRADKDAEAQWVQSYVVAQQSKRLGAILLPLRAGDKPKTADAPVAEPAEPEKKDEPVQREPASATESDASATESDVSATGSDVSAGIEGALRGGGRPLDSATRRGMEARFGQDFTGVRIHDHASANSAAAGIAARAFTVGEDIVFGSGGYDATTTRGRYLLAHELAHVVQQRGREPSNVVHRRSAWESFTVWLGTSEGTWSDEELQAYLAAVTAADVIDGAHDADNKARAIVAKWKTSAPGFNLAARQKVLLIAEMLDGPTLDEDENAILDLLENSDATDLRVIMTAPEVPIAKLEADLHGEENDRLNAWVAARFEGGRDAVAAGRITVLGAAIPQSAPPGRFSATTVDGWFASGRDWQEIVALIERMKEGDRDKTLRYLIETRRPQLSQRVDRAEAAAPDVGIRAPDDPAVAGAKATRLVTDRVLLHFFAGAVPATEADLISVTHPARPKRAQLMKEALVSAKPGTVFESQLVGEQEDYETKLTKRMDTMVAQYYDDLVTAAPPRTHALSEFEAMAKLAKDEVDHVFRGFYRAEDHPPFVADQTDPKGKVTKAGTLHDNYASVETDLTGHGPSYRRESAMNMLRYFFVSNRWVRRLNTAHGASPNFDHEGKPTNTEAEILERVGYAYLDATPADINIKRINDIDRAWFGKASQGEVYVSLIRPDDPVEERLLRWTGFQMLIHEYMHTLTHPDYRAYAESFSTSSPQYNTLMEGVDCVLSEVVWEHVAPKVTNPDIRLTVEGSESAKLPPIEVPHASQRRYPSYAEALALANIGGIEAVYAAFFLGRVERIGGPPFHPGLQPKGGKP